MEVLVATAIVVLVAVVAFPAVRAITGRAQGSACAERLHTLGNALAMYANDNEGWLPPATTVEFGKDAPAAELAASPGLLRELAKPYGMNEEAWFCPVDPHRGENVLWLGQRHRLTGFRVNPKPSGGGPAWPPRAQLGKEDGPLASDAYGVPARDSDRQFRDVAKPTSNHESGVVNVVGHDLSLSRRRASEMVGG